MKCKPRIIGQFLIGFVFLIQSIWMSGNAAAFATHDGAQLLICQPSDQYSNELLQASEELMDALGIHDKQHSRDNADHCSFCAVSHVPAPQTLNLLGVITFEETECAADIYEPSLIYLPQGPPLGGRAPPYTI